MSILSAPSSLILPFEMTAVRRRRVGRGLVKDVTSKGSVLGTITLPKPSTLSFWTRLPEEVLNLIAIFLNSDSKHPTCLKNFILTCKRNKVAADPVLYRSVTLGNILEMQKFSFFVQIITDDKARFVRAIELPDSFSIDTSLLGVGMVEGLLERLINLEELSITIWNSSSTTSPVLASTTMSTTPPFTSLWTPSMFRNLPFQLKRFVGSFSNPDVSAALFASQPTIRRWASKGNVHTVTMQNWVVPSLDAISFDVSPSLQYHHLSMEDLPFRARIRELVIHGTGATDVFHGRGLLTFVNISSLSITMLKSPHMTQYDMLDRVIKSAPKLEHLTFRTLGVGAAAIGAERQKYVAQLDPFISFSQVPSMPGLRSIIIVIQHGSMPKITLDAVVAVMDRCPNLVELDVVPMGGQGQAYIRSSTGHVRRSMNILRKPCLQDHDWF